MKPALLTIAIAALLVGALEKRDLLLLTSPPAPIHASDERKDLLPEDFVWFKRHERASRECRGQQYISQCCTDARTETTCIYALSAPPNPKGK